MDNSQIELITSFFKKLDRLGPGCDSQTQKALSYIPGLEYIEEIADIGCGTGAQTLALAKYTKARITASDLMPEVIEKLDAKIKNGGYQDRISTLVADMDDLPFHENQFDLIWSEGAIYNIGFENGLRKWGKFLKENGYIAVSEATWLTNERPREIEEFWQAAYPEIGTVEDYLKRMEYAGFMTVKYFTLPAECWAENYYEPIKRRLEEFEKENVSDAAKSFMEAMRREIEMYEKYKDYYGYVFYIGQKL